MSNDRQKETSARLMAALRTRRKSIGLSQEVVAEKMGMARTTVSRLERTTTPRFITLLKYANALDVALVPVPKELVD